MQTRIVCKNWKSSHPNGIRSPEEWLARQLHGLWAVGREVRQKCKTEIAMITAAAVRMGLETKRVLVVDDDPVIRLLVARMLRETGAEVRLVDRPEDGVRIAQEQGADLILADLEMPTLSGDELCTRFKSSAGTRGIPVLLVSGNSVEEGESLARRCGAEGYLEKPFTQDTLVRSILAALRTADK